MKTYHFRSRIRNGILDLPDELRLADQDSLEVTIQLPAQAATYPAHKDPRELTKEDRRRLMQEVREILGPFPANFKPLSREEANER